MPDKFIVNVCLTGMVAKKSHNCHLPVSPEEIAADVRTCVGLGASIVHVHARDQNEEPDWTRERYQEIFRAIRADCPDVVICASTSGRRVTDLKMRTACLDTDPRPDMASLTLGSINFLREGVLNSPDTVRALAERMDAKGVKPELEIFDLGMARTAARLIAEGLIARPAYANVLLGNVASAGSSLGDLGAIVAHLPSDLIWCVSGIGREQRRACTLGMLYGRGVRIGLEDNLYLDPQKTPATNAVLVGWAVEAGKLLGMTACSTSETRALLGL